jgi:hypothetical protein
LLGRNNRSEVVVSEIISFALGERFESIVRPDDPQMAFTQPQGESGHDADWTSLLSLTLSRRMVVVLACSPRERHKRSERFRPE